MLIAVTNLINTLNDITCMPTFRLTESKVKEYLGSNLQFFLNPFKEKNFSLGMVGIFLFVIVFFIIFKSYLVLVIGIILALIAYQIRRDIKIHLGALKIKELVNDSNLLWLNYHPDEKGSISKRSEEGKISPTTFKILAYLNREGDYRGISAEVPSLKNSNSAYQNLKRLAERGIVEPESFKYRDWEFLIVDKNNQKLDTWKAKRINKILVLFWKEMLKTELR
jgi:hypothetical protein